jgi:hypothetical protein
MLCMTGCNVLRERKAAHAVKKKRKITCIHIYIYICSFHLSICLYLHLNLLVRVQLIGMSDALTTTHISIDEVKEVGLVQFTSNR